MTGRVPPGHAVRPRASSRTCRRRSPARSRPATRARRIRPRFAELPRRSGLAPRSVRGGAPGERHGRRHRPVAPLPRRRQVAHAVLARRPSGAATPVHDHLAWGLVGLYRGEQDEEIFAHDGGALGLAERRQLVPGDFYELLPPRDDIHRVRTTSRRDLGLDPPADERHGLRLAAHLRRRIRRRPPVSVGLRQLGVPAGRPQPKPGLTAGRTGCIQAPFWLSGPRIHCGGTAFDAGRSPGQRILLAGRGGRKETAYE